MEIIDGLLQMSETSFEVMFFICFLLAFTESFFSPLPVLVIIVTNSVLLGFTSGLIASLLGSILGSIIFFFVCKKFSDTKLISKIKTKRINKIIEWIRVQGFVPMTICYSCPFIPGFLITIASGIAKKSINKFLPGMLSGKVIMFSVISYIGSDLKGFLVSPLKIAIVILIITVSLFVGKKLSKKMEGLEESTSYI